MTSPAAAINGAIGAVLKDWERQRKAALNRRYRLVRSSRLTIRDAAFSVMREAYRAASDNGALPALPVKPRQIMYAQGPRSCA